VPEINFFWDPPSDNILQERDELGAVTAGYTAEPGLYGNVISQNRGGVESQVHFDAQGSTLAVTDDNQNVTDTFAYTAFGEVTEQTGTTEVPFQYIGQKGHYSDSLTGQIMARRRPYEPLRARWLSPDPLGVRPSDASGYAYTRNRATVGIDPTGRECEFYFAPAVFVSDIGGKIGPNCKIEDLPKVFFECMVQSAGDYDEFVDCMEGRCGPGDYKEIAISALCEWLGNLYCCDELERGGRKANPCKCGRDPASPKGKPRKCLDPQAGDSFDKNTDCQDCCQFHFCTQAVQESCEVAINGGKVTSLYEIAVKIISGQIKTPQTCFLACADCP